MTTAPPPEPEDNRSAWLRASDFLETRFGQGTVSGVIFLIGFLIWIAFFDPLR